MNISQPVVSSIQTVDFGVLSSAEIKKLSVKRITSPDAVDALLHPIPGGLHDPAMGAFLDNICSTCHLDKRTCPGHCGHIELPVHVYHSAFLPQTYTLLRAQCAFCKRLKLSRAEISRFQCKLTLIRHGLIREAEELENISLRSRNRSKHPGDEESDSSSEGEGSNNLIKEQLAFVRSSIKRAPKRSGAPMALDESESSARNAVLKEFFKSVTAIKQCRNCNGVSPAYRKNGCSSIFRKALSEKQRAKNAQNALGSMENPLVSLTNALRDKNKEARRQGRTSFQQRTQAEHSDEGVADLESHSGDEGEGITVLGAMPGEASEESEQEANTQEELGSAVGFFDQSSATGAAKRQKKKPDETEKEVFINPNEVHAALTQLFEREKEMMRLIYRSSLATESTQSPSADMFFIRCLIVPPNRYRKEQSTGAEEISESQDNESYRKILLACDDLYEIRREVQGVSTEGRRVLRTYDDLQRAWLNLQDYVNALFDKQHNPAKGPIAAMRNPDGVKQKLEKKEGLFRGNIMGKRVNFAARSVISPDPNLETNEIGIPPVFAKKLTYPEPVTTHTFEELREAVKRGPENWPGAVAIEQENGQVINLKSKSDEERQAIANMLLAPSNVNVVGVRNKKVHRHLNNGDIVIMNRQPTLHKPSMMAHRAKVLPGEKTIRLHYANCNTYNADFDGDEMNMHFPQNEVARAEALQIADTDHQYLSATAGAPLRGLIQDHISISVWLTCVDTFFNRSQYQELLYSCIRPESNHTQSDRILMVEPAFLKPKCLWTGKQVITTILKNITPASHAPLYVVSKSGTPAEKWWPSLSQEGEVRVLNGELVTGILDKKQIGPSAGGLIHAVYEAYGHVVAGKLLSILSRLLTKLLNMRAFSCGVEDIILTVNGEKDRTDELLAADTIGLAVASKYVSLQDGQTASDHPELLRRLEEIIRDDEKQAGLDAIMNSRTAELSSSISRKCMPNGLYKAFPRNQMQTMTVTGAKGSMVNANLISCNLGQQVLEGRRVPTMISGKTLPCFRPFDASVRAGGYIVDRFLTGIRPQEYYFHAMAGREGLIDTAVKTSRSGYLQRCLVKGMEGLRVEYDTSVRDADGSMIQTVYGEDGLDITRQPKLLDFQFQSKNFMSLFAGLDVREAGSRVFNPKVIEYNKDAIRSLKKNSADEAEDPVLARYFPASCAGSVSERFYLEASKYIASNPDDTIRAKGEKNTQKLKKQNFWDLLYVNYMKAVVQAGETVGVIASQSVGEPSTQMTLNTFHLAGHSAKNVTLGIPRLREILMTASKAIKTPTMSVFPIPELPREQWQMFAKGLSRLSLAEVVDKIRVKERKGDAGAVKGRTYDLQIKFYPSEEYTIDHGIQIDDILKTIEVKFLPDLQRVAKAEFKKRAAEKSLRTVQDTDAHPDIGQGQRMRDEQPPPVINRQEGSDVDDDDDEEDAGYARRMANRNEDVTYEDPDEDEQEIARENEREESPEVDQEDEGYGGSPRSSVEPEDVEEENGDHPGAPSTGHAKETAERIKNAFPEVVSFVFDHRHGSSCNILLQYPGKASKIMLLPLVSRVAHRTLIQAIPNLASCMLSMEKDEDGQEIPVVHTQGVNFSAMREYQHIINPHRILSNDIGAMLVHYGVEAARATIIQELRAVFSGHSIAVDARHLTLVADYMTRNGDFSPFSRHGMADKTSPFAKMSFESTVRILSDAALAGARDELDNPSARITVGKLGRMGTGMFDVFTSVDAKLGNSDSQSEDDEL